MVVLFFAALILYSITVLLLLRLQSNYYIIINIIRRVRGAQDCSRHELKNIDTMGKEACLSRRL